LADLGVERTDFVGVYTLDRDRAVKFYGETLGLKRNERAHAEWPEFETGNLTILITTPEQTGVTFSPSVGAMEKLKSEGVEFYVDEVYDSGVCHMAFFKDPDGNALMLHNRYAPYADGSKP
jgi:predicted enzyme related to lactoylglutathione lyase